MLLAAFRRIALVTLTAGAICGCQMYGTMYGYEGGGGTRTGPGYNGSNMAGIAISGFAFSPNSVSFPASGGVTVTWTNYDGTTHTVTSDSTSLPFDMTLSSNGVFSLAVPKGTAAGTYKYHCRIHTYMTGSLTIS